MTIEQTLKYTLRTFLVLKKERVDPWWARLLVGSVLALSVAMGLMVLSVFLLRRNRQEVTEKVVTAVDARRERRRQSPER